ncbi:MAG: hypothetical protein GQ535_12400 [Rhodobacteraceae bacterium]|nr:hypothetical protein [Paracoccaceae bacterium]
MADRISDEAFEVLTLSKKLEFVAMYLGAIDEVGLREVGNEDIATMLMHSLVMARHRDDERLAVLRLEIAFEQAAEPDSNVVSWPVIARNVRKNVYREGDLRCEIIVRGSE